MPHLQRPGRNSEKRLGIFSQEGTDSSILFLFKEGIIGIGIGLRLQQLHEGEQRCSRTADKRSNKHDTPPTHLGKGLRITSFNLLDALSLFFLDTFPFLLDLLLLQHVFDIWKYQRVVAAVTT